MLFSVDVIDICGDLHPLEPAVTIGRTSRTVADTAHGTVVVRPYGSTLVYTAFIKLARCAPMVAKGARPTAKSVESSGISRRERTCARDAT
jgi:hypothetical protein